MEKQVYIHIGIHKTGTTSLQNMLLENRAYFSELGLYYPAFCFVLGGHHNLAWELQEDVRWEAEYGNIAGLLDEIEQGKQTKYLVSSEDICRSTEKQVETLYLYFKKYKPKVIVYIRNQFDYIVSSWSSAVKTGSSQRSFIEHYDFCINNRLDRIDYNVFLNLWAKIFGKENIIVKIFRKNLGFELQKEFLNIIDIPLHFSTLNVNNKLNRSLPLQQLNVLRTTNKYIEGFSRDKRRDFVKDLLAAINENYKVNENLLLPKNMIGLRKKTRVFFRDSNKLVAQNYFGRERLFKKNRFSFKKKKNLFLSSLFQRNSSK